MIRKRFFLVCCLGVMVSEPALAHTPIQGIGSFYNGLLHPVLVPAHVLLLLAVGLLLSKQDSNRLDLALGTFVIATILGLVGAWFSIVTEMEMMVLALSAITGLLIAISPRMRIHWFIIIALLAGFFLGLDSAQDELSGKDKLLSLFGSAVAIYFLVLYPIALADKFNKKNWQPVALRIIGSWVAASSLLVLALTFSGKTA